MYEPRIIRETGFVSRLSEISEPILADLGFRLVRICLSGSGGRTIRVMIERPEGGVNIGDCTRVSRALSSALDVESVMAGSYTLEISSPGLDRFLVRQSDFEHSCGREVKIELSELFGGRKRFRGVIVAAERGFLHLLENGVKQELPFSLIGEARLVLKEERIGVGQKKKGFPRRIPASADFVPGETGALPQGKEKGS